MNNHELSTKASAILRQFPPEKMKDLYDEMVDFMYGWQMYVDANADPELDEELTKIMLLRTAIALSRIADGHAQTFEKISRKHWAFWKSCEAVADRMVEERNSRIA